MKIRAKEMANLKYKVFSAVLSDGQRVELRAPQGKVTEKTAAMYAGHWCRIQHGINAAEVAEIKGRI